jgi:hypothetical protein
MMSDGATRSQYLDVMANYHRYVKEEQEAYSGIIDTNIEDEAPTKILYDEIKPNVRTQ